MERVRCIPRVHKRANDLAGGQCRRRSGGLLTSVYLVVVVMAPAIHTPGERAGHTAVCCASAVVMNELVAGARIMRPSLRCEALGLL